MNRSVQNLPIKRKLMTVMMLTSSAALLLSCVGFVGYQLLSYIQDVKQDLATLGDVIAANSTAALSFRDQSSAEETLRGLKAEPRILKACLYAQDGTLFVTYSRDGSGQICPPSIPRGGSATFEHNRLTLSRNVQLDGQTIGTLCLQADLGPEVLAYLKRAANILLFVMAASLLAALFLSRKLQHFISDPILGLANVARVVTDKKDYSIRAEPQSGDETGLLIGAFNEMLGQIQRRDDALRGANDELERHVQERTKELRASEASLRLMFDNNPLPTWVHDAATLQFLQVNDAALNHYGYTRDEFLRMTIGQIRPAEDPPSPFESAAGPGVGLQFCGGLRHQKKGGEIFDAEIASHTLELPGRKAVLVVVQDVMERKRAEAALRMSEQQLRQSQKMEAVGRLAGGVAHDFNNLLTVMLGYCDILLQRTEPSNPHCRHVEEIQRAGERAASLTRQLLAFSRKQVLQPKILGLNTIVFGLDKMLRRLIGEDIELRTVLEPDLENVKADPGQIEQVIMNLAVNARDAMPRGGKLTIQTANVLIDQANSNRKREMTPGRYVMLAVSDTGVGMTDDVKTHLFEPFFTTKGTGKGTGLGLATSYGIIKQSEGEIQVYSEPGHGTTFKIYLPCTVEKTTGAENGLKPKPLPHGNETILVVEDEPGVRGLTCDECGYTVLESCDGADGLRVAHEYDLRKIDLTVSDVIMPIMSGKELADRLRVLRPDIKILLTSGYTDEALAHHGVLEMGLAFLEKPFSRAKLAQTVREILDKAS
jgi:two-component system cell cycle sensor histidine kinase/response regulator CckA